MWGTQTLSSMATKLVNCDRMEYSLLNSMMKDFSSSFLPWNTETVSAKTRERPGFACDSKPRVLLRRNPGSRPRNPLWWLWLWACEETACMYQRSFNALEGGGGAGFMKGLQFLPCLWFSAARWWTPTSSAPHHTSFQKESPETEITSQTDRWGVLGLHGLFLLQRGSSEHFLRKSSQFE